MRKTVWKALSRWRSGEPKCRDEENEIDLSRLPFPAAVIGQAVRWFFRFQLSLRDIEELLFERGVTVSHESIRRGTDKFGACFARQVRATRRTPGLT
jgi:transposase-like protein